MSCRRHQNHRNNNLRNAHYLFNNIIIQSVKKVNQAKYTFRMFICTIYVFLSEIKTVYSQWTNVGEEK